MKTLPNRTEERSRPPHRRDERGIAALFVIYGLSIFSVLASTMLTDPELERAFRSGQHPDLHLVLFGGRTDSEKLVGRLNLPTLERTSTQEDFGVEIQVPLPAATDTSIAFVPGSTYSVQLAADVRVCCDTGDGACANLQPDAEAPAGSVNRTVNPKTGGEARLQFELSTVPPADNLALDPTSGQTPFLVKALRDQSADPTVPLQNSDLVCKLKKGVTTIASGTLALQPSAPTATSGPFTGKIQLKYGGE
jgi:hypothetical protein